MTITIPTWLIIAVLVMWGINTVLKIEFWRFNREMTRRRRGTTVR